TRHLRLAAHDAPLQAPPRHVPLARRSWCTPARGRRPRHALGQAGHPGRLPADRGAGRWEAADGRCRHRERRHAAARRPKPVPLPPRTARARRGTTHAHVDGLRPRRRRDPAHRRLARPPATAHDDRGRRAALDLTPGMDLSSRRPGPDVVRAVAMAGVVVMNYHGYLILRGGQRDVGALADLFDPWTGPLSTRFAATFVLTAGVGVTLMSRSSIGDADRTRALRWRLVRRGLLLYGLGLLFDMIWRGTILPFYGAMFVGAAVLLTMRSRWVIVVGAASAITGAAIRWWRYEAQLDGRDTSWLTNPGPRSPRGLLFDLFVNGTHPLLPWLAFFCAGIVLGRLLVTDWWRPAVTGTGFVLFAA